MKNIIFILLFLFVNNYSYAQYSTGYKGAWVGGTAMTGLNILKSNRFSDTIPVFQIGFGFTFQGRKGSFLDIVPISFIYTNKRFGSAASISFRYYLNSQN